MSSQCPQNKLQIARPITTAFCKLSSFISLPPVNYIQFFECIKLFLPLSSPISAFYLIYLSWFILNFTVLKNSWYLDKVMSNSIRSYVRMSCFILIGSLNLCPCWSVFSMRTGTQIFLVTDVLLAGYLIHVQQILHWMR